MSVAAHADLILRGGRVHTVDPHDRIVDAVAVAGNRILAAGSDDQLAALTGPQTNVVELRGRSVLPGFVEAHNHMSAYGTAKMGIDCKAPGMDSIAALTVAIRERAQRTPPGRWIHARGYNDTRLAERRHPHRSDLDAAAPEHPVIVTRTCGHIVAVNSRALGQAGITDETPNPAGGVYERANGRLTGVVFEAAQGPLLAAAAHSRAELREALAIASRDWLRAGITSSHEAGTGGDQHIHALQDCVRDASLGVRVYFTVWLALGITQALAYLDSGLQTGFGDDRLKLGPFKVMVDGASSGPTAATRADYTSAVGLRGILYYEQPELDALVERAHVAGYQVTAHTVGDRAIEMMLDAYEKVLAQHPRQDHRHRIEHCAICPPDLVDRIARLGVLPVIQPAFFWEFGDGYLRRRRRRLGARRSRPRAPGAASGRSACAAASPRSAPRPLDAQRPVTGRPSGARVRSNRPIPSR